MSKNPIKIVIHSRKNILKITFLTKCLWTFYEKKILKIQQFQMCTYKYPKKINSS